MDTFYLFLFPMNLFYILISIEKNYRSVEIELLIIYISNDNILISHWKYN